MNFSDVFNAEITNNFTGENFHQEVILRDFDFHRNFISFVKLIDSTTNSGSQNSNGWGSFSPIYEANSIQSENPSGIEYKYEYFDNHYRYKLGLACISQ